MRIYDGLRLNANAVKIISRFRRPFHAQVLLHYKVYRDIIVSSVRILQNYSVYQRAVVERLKKEEEGHFEIIVREFCVTTIVRRNATGGKRV